MAPPCGTRPKQSKSGFSRIGQERATRDRSGADCRIYQRKHDACQRAIAALGNALNETEIDAVIVIGDDQHELFREECIPAFAIFTGADLLDIPPPIETAHPSHPPASLVPV